MDTMQVMMFCVMGNILERTINNGFHYVSGGGDEFIGSHTKALMQPRFNPRMKPFKNCSTLIIQTILCTPD